MSDETTLLPCPFCGGEAEMGVNKESTVREYFIGCMNCHIRLYKIGYKRFWSEAEAIEAWNTRAELGRTCRSTTDDSAWCFVCSECGKSFPRNHLHDAHNHGEINFCPNCGAKVVGE